MNDTTETASPRASWVPPAGPVNGELRERVQKLRLGSPSAASDKRGNVAWLPWVLCGLLAITWAGVAIRSYRVVPASSNVNPGDTANPGTTATPGQPQSRPNTPPAAAGATVHEAKGNIIAAQQISVSPIDVGGRLIELNFVEGDERPQGFILAKIDSTSFKAQLDETQQALGAAIQRREAARKRWEEQDPKSVREVEKTQAKAELDEGKALELRAKQEVDRQESIKDTVALSIREVQQAQSDYSAAKARTIRLKAALEILEVGPRPEKIAAVKADFSSAEGDVRVAEARVAQAKWRVDNCDIKAPITGTILSKKAEKWNLVNPMAFSGGGSICDMADLSKLELEVEIAEREISKLTLAQPCRFRPDAYPDRTYNGTLDRIMPIANRDKSIVLVRVTIVVPKDEKPGTYLKPGMGGVVSFLAPTK